MNSKTTTPKLENKVIKWHLIDAKDKVLGKTAVEVATLLIGKNKVTQTLNQNWGDKVVITNASQFRLTGRKMKNKEYKHYTGFPGGLKTESVQSLSKRKPTEVLRLAIKRMLPNNKLRKQRMANLYIYEGNEHPHEAQITK